ncbi:Major sperm protein [Cynara cardunculus var. scolymus]|uniref:Major sperm protein n=1 Tax=Cynara cardunculus var. scolymus TaxID=59895 RepID=A0A124S0S0_CYNCS|nr:Major sperm protein [Cynara cardunculus var. scolymus]
MTLHFEARVFVTIACSLSGEGIKYITILFWLTLGAKMKPDILEMKPQELRFIFELKKQSSCSVQMINKTNHHVAFKVKTTNPKKYCVRPNTGVIDPNSVCDFTGIRFFTESYYASTKGSSSRYDMQGQVLSSKYLCPGGDKRGGRNISHGWCFMKMLVLMVIPLSDSSIWQFTKEDGKTVDEKRLKVVLIPAPDSPESSPINETLKLVQKNDGRELKDDVVQKHSSHAKVDEGMEVSKGEGESVEATRKEETIKRKDEDVKRKEETMKRKDEDVKRNEESAKRSKEFIKRNNEPMQMNDTEELRLVKDLEETKSKVKELESKLSEDLLRNKRHRAQVGFPLLFVFMVGLVSLYLGYLLHC